MIEPAVRFRALILAGLLACGAAAGAAAGAPGLVWGSASAALSRVFASRVSAPAGAATGFPLNPRVVDLANGLRVVAVPFREPDTIAFCAIVRAGARNETGPGEAGLARFLERLVLGIGRSSTAAAEGDALFRLGPRTASFSTEDYACRSILFAGRENLEAVLRAEAARLMGTRDIEAGLRDLTPVFEREARTAARNPGARLAGALRSAAFERHPYRDYPGGAPQPAGDHSARAEAARTFGSRFYTPENTVLLAVGDIDADRFIEQAGRHFGGWVRSGFEFQPAVEPPQKEPKRAHVEWTFGTTARLAIAFRGPAFSDTDTAPAAFDIIAAAAFSPVSPLPQKLVLKEKRCLSLGAEFRAARDPSLLVLTSVVRDPADLPAVEAEILDEIERIKRDGLTPRALTEAKARLRASMARELSTAEGAARALATLIGLTGDPASLNRLSALYDRVLPSDVQQAARAFFKPSNSTTVTLGPGQAK